MELTIKQIFMSAVEIRADLIQRITNMDERFLKAMHLMAVAYDNKDEDPILGYETDGTAVTASAFLKQADAAMEEVVRGEYITVEELDKHTKEWLTRTK